MKSLSNFPWIAGVACLLALHAGHGLIFSAFGDRGEVVAAFQQQPLRFVPRLAIAHADQRPVAFQFSASQCQMHADFATSIETSQKGLWLPSSFSLTEEQVDRTADVLRRLPGHA